MSTEVLPLPPLSQVPAQAHPGPRRRALSMSIGMIPALTLAIWLTCLTVGVFGFLLKYPIPHLPGEPAPVVAKIIQVNLSDNPTPGNTDAGDSSAAPDPPDSAEPPPPAVPAPPAISEAPPLLAVAAPDPAIAFALPVEAPSRVVDAKQAAPMPAPKHAAVAPAAPTASGPAIRHLTLGHGEGAQAKPDYPREARLAGQEGVVIIRFTINEAGKVEQAEIASACRWPMLNQEALRTIRDRWGPFPPGERRLCDVPIHFELK